MTGKKHDLSSRFWSLLERAKPHLPPVRDFDPRSPDEITRLALGYTIFPGNPMDDAIAVAFAKMGLNVRAPEHWKLVVGIFSAALVGEWPKLAAAKFWTPARLQQLQTHASEIRSRNRSILSDKAVARILKTSQPFRDIYGQYAQATIEERIGEAKNWNRDLDELVQSHLTSIRQYYESVGLEWTDELKSKLTESYLTLWSGPESRSGSS
jgi:hypothetical protein